MSDPNKLRQLAAWYREFAERAGNPAIWDARLHMAEDLEAEAGRQERRAIDLVKKLRVDACRLIEMVATLSNPELKKESASRALALSQRAEAIETSLAHPEVIRINIERYQATLAHGITDGIETTVVIEMLADAELLQDMLHVTMREASMMQRQFVLIVVDRDTDEFTAEGPMADDRGWNTVVVDAQRIGRSIRCFAMGDLTPDAAAAEWQGAYGGTRIAAGAIVSPKLLL